MKPVTIEYGKTKNLGNFESERVSLKVELEPVETEDQLKSQYIILKKQVNALLDLKQQQQKTNDYNPETIKWVRVTGEKGVYERYPLFQQKPQLTPDYTKLVEDLQKHEGKLTRGNLFFWLFSDGTTIGRKPST
jgi:hypothetical protein